MTNQSIPMTFFGAERLKKELHKLKTEDRYKVIQAIADARANGDLKENADYHAAREQQGFLEGRIMELEYKLAHAVIVDISKLPKDDKVIFGATVKLINLDKEHVVSYQIVGEDEADLKIGKLSINSPLAKAMIGKREGETFELKTPSGIMQYEIEEVIYI